MKGLISILLLVSCLLSASAKQQELSLKQCKRLTEISQLDSVVVHFTAKGNHLSFVQHFSGAKPRGSKQIVLRQQEIDQEHFQRALAIVELTIDFFLSNYQFSRKKIQEKSSGLESVFQFEQQVPIDELWNNMYKTFSWTKKTGLVDNVQIIIYSP